MLMNLRPMNWSFNEPRLRRGNFAMALYIMNILACLSNHCREALRQFELEERVNHHDYASSWLAYEGIE